MAMRAEHRSNLQPFTGNGDVSIWVKNSRVGRYTWNKQIAIVLKDYDAAFQYNCWFLLFIIIGLMICKYDKKLV